MNLLIKRLSDIFLSLFFIILLLPLWGVIAIVIKINSSGPVFYKHLRVGKDSKEFICLKFRSMYHNSNETILPTTSDDKRITRVGKFLRRTSLDEIPQFINVLLGDMSIVGPRPALPSQVKEFSNEDFDKLLVKPGLTGWTQINGRNSLPYKRRVEMDSWYGRNWSLFLDFQILFKTLFVLFKQEGIYETK